MHASADSISIAFLGDVYLGAEAFFSFAPELRDALPRAYYVVANYEGPLTNHPGTAKDKILLRSSPQAARVLKEWGVNAVTLANNHMFDSGIEGFNDTVRNLDDVGIKFFGAGENCEKATQPLVLSHGSSRVALLSCSCEKTESRSAGSDSYGCARLNREWLLTSVNALSKQYDAVVVVPHWGLCDYALPSPEQVYLARDIVDAGATAVVGHHSHVVQGIVPIGESVVAYSLGNFAFAEYMYRGHMVEQSIENNRGLVLQVKLCPGKTPSWDPIHTINRNGLISIDNTDEREQRFQISCRKLLDTGYDKHWSRTVRQRLIRRILHWLQPRRWSRINPDHFRGLFLMLKELVVNRRQGKER